MHYANISDMVDCYSQNLHDRDIYSDEMVDLFYELINPEVEFCE